MRLKRFKTTNYKVIDDTDWVDVDENVTALVGKNESGKTGVLRSLWKSRNRASVDFDKLNDYPRDRFSRERKQNQYVVQTEYTLTEDEGKQLAATVTSAPKIPKVVGQRTWYYGEDKVSREFYVTDLEPLRRTAKDAHDVVDSIVKSVAASHQNLEEGVRAAAKTFKASATEKAHLWAAGTVTALKAFQTTLQSAAPDAEVLKAEKAKLATALESAEEGDPLEAALEWVDKHMPIFVYFDDYGQLETRIFLSNYIQRLTKPDAKTRTQRALFTWSGIDPQEILTLGRPREQSETDEVVQRRKDKRRALLQSASFSLTGDWVKWWTGEGHKLHFDADGDDLVLQVSDNKNEFPIPFEERSQGFQWFFSFYLIFLVEAESEHRDAILLLDEPGLHLHPTLQQKLIALFDRMAKKNQMLYSTHLPFLVDGDHLERVRTVYLSRETQKTVVSPDVRAGADHDTLFPLQAALGYSIAQTLFMGSKSVIVEGVTDYWLIKALDAIVPVDDALGSSVILVPAGGTSRLMPLASLMFGAAGKDGKNMAVLLDSDKEGANAKARLEADLFPKDSRIVTLGNVWNAQKASIEDLVDLDAYVEALNGAGFKITITAADKKGADCNVDACVAAFKRLGLGDYDHVAKSKAALWLVDRWGNHPGKVPADTKNRAVALFAALKAKFA